MKYRNRILEPGTTISGFGNSKKKKKINAVRPTLYFFDVTVNTHIFFFGLIGQYFVIILSKMKVLANENRGHPHIQCQNTLIFKLSGPTLWHILLTNILFKKEEIR